MLARGGLPPVKSPPRRGFPATDAAEQGCSGRHPPEAILAAPGACGGIGRRARLRALWTEWSVEVRVLSGALEKARATRLFHARPQPTRAASRASGRPQTPDAASSSRSNVARSSTPPKPSAATGSDGCPPPPYLEEGTWTGYEISGRKRLLPAFADKRLGTLSVDGIRAFVSEQAEVSAVGRVEWRRGCGARHSVLIEGAARAP
jgi:hypothetical protein